MAGLLVERPGDHDPLLLSARQHGSHVADEGAVCHRHRDDVVVDRRHPGAFHDPLEVGALREEADVVRDGASKQLVVLHHHPDHGAIILDADSADGFSANEDVAVAGLY